MKSSSLFITANEKTWWEDLPFKEQTQYLKEHPQSRLSAIIQIPGERIKNLSSSVRKSVVSKLSEVFDKDSIIKKLKAIPNNTKKRLSNTLKSAMAVKDKGKKLKALVFAATKIALQLGVLFVSVAAMGNMAPMMLFSPGIMADIWSKTGDGLDNIGSALGLVYKKTSRRKQNVDAYDDDEEYDEQEDDEAFDVSIKENLREVTEGDIKAAEDLNEEINKSAEGEATPKESESTESKDEVKQETEEKTETDNPEVEKPKEGEQTEKQKDSEETDKQAEQQSEPESKPESDVDTEEKDDNKENVEEEDAPEEEVKKKKLKGKSKKSKVLKTKKGKK